MRRQTRRTSRPPHAPPVLIVGSVRQGEPARPARRVRTPKRRSSLLVRHAARIEQWLWLLAGALLMLSIWTSPRMQPRQLIVNGVPPAAQPVIERHLRQLWERQPYSVRLGVRALENELTRFPWIAQVAVRPQLPAQLQIDVQPREAFVEVRATTSYRTQLQPQRIFIDPAGIVFQSPNPPDRAPGGVIFLGSAAMPPEGVLKEGSPLWRAFELLRTLSKHGRLAQYVRTVRIEPEGELQLTCQAVGGATMQFRLGDATPYQQQAQMIHLLLTNLPAQHAQWEYVDLKSPFYPAVKPLSKGAEENRGQTP